ncbi:hypothetical protein JMJ56_18690 [Belnapia sp. T18]|uniref:Bacterial surface antigen (D15) domain-containing protein n=1 Tax=Belnapia arida TaxID=2804533 RepID=A0ABS1U5X7_9PROT|nr:hypothetical protein [Belnapia arida]MBL6080053.1 hypothetical protein [Belnapia arida]
MSLALRLPLLAAAGTSNFLFMQHPAFAQPLPNTTVSVNYSYAALLGFGGYSVGGLRASAYTLPLSLRLYERGRDGWKVNLLLPLQLGLYDFEANPDGRRLKVSQWSLAALPGAELHIPVTDSLVVKPFAQGGVGHAFGNGISNADSWIYLAGVRTRYERQIGNYRLAIGNGMVLTGSRDMGPGQREDYWSLQAAVEIRRPLQRRIGDLVPDVGLYVAEYYYPKALRFDRYLRSPLRVTNQTEIGFSIGSSEPARIFGIANPRIGASVIFGDGLTVYHVNFGFPF